MASNAPIVVNDGASTPVAHTFTGVSVQGDLALYTNRAEPFVGGRESLSLRMKEKTSVRTVISTLKIPRIVTETINGVSVSRVVDYMTVKTETIVPLTWSPSQAKTGRVMNANVQQHATVQAMADDGEFVW